MKQAELCRARLPRAVARAACGLSMPHAMPCCATLCHAMPCEPLASPRPQSVPVAPAPGPAVAIPAALKKAGMSVADVDVYEINEAFASQVRYWNEMTCSPPLELVPSTPQPQWGVILHS